MMKFKWIIVICLILFQTNAVLAEEEEDFHWKAFSAWAEETLNESYEKGIYPECFEKCDMTVNVTRGETAELALEIYKKATGKNVSAGTSPFVDTSDDAIVAAYGVGLIDGVGEGLFLPAEDITREAAATILERTYKLIKGEEIKEERKDDKKTDFLDDAEISDWAYCSVYNFTNKKFILGANDKFMPKDNCTREQAVAIALRIVKDLGI